MIPEPLPVSPLNPNPVTITVDIPVEVYRASTDNLLLNLGLLILYSLFYWLATYFVQKQKDIL